MIMIDEKKIDDSVEKIFKNEIFLKYTEIREKFPHGSVSCLYDEDIVKDAMKKTAHWAIEQFLKDLWHDASEQPSEDCKIVIMYKHNGIELVAQALYYQETIQDFRNIAKSMLHTDEEINEVVKNRWEAYNIEGWFSLEDLLPKQEGGKK